MSQNHDTSLSHEQFVKVTKAIALWLTIRARWEPRFARLQELTPEQMANQLGADVWHSALLYRMLVEGKEPLPEPPPIAHSYPDYKTVEGV